MTERRAVPRHRTFLKGVLSFQNGTASEDALVRNLSERGAMIELPHPNAPDAFDLLIPARDLRAPARVFWRSGGRLGLGLESARARAAPASRPPQDEGY